MHITPAVISAPAGIKQKNHSVQRTISIFVPRCGSHSINWIPAGAGMTGFKHEQ
jgi:hypothetical protein